MTMSGCSIHDVASKAGLATTSMISLLGHVCARTLSMARDRASWPIVRTIREIRGWDTDVIEELTRNIGKTTLVQTT